LVYNEISQTVGGEAKNEKSYFRWIRAPLFAALGTAKADTKKYDNEDKYVEALQNYLEYAHQVEGLGRPDPVAWGKKNSAFMILKRHKLDPAIDLRQAKNWSRRP